MEITQEILYNDIQTVKHELGELRQEFKQELKQEIANAKHDIIVWVVALFVGTAVLTIAGIGLYTNAALLLGK